MLGVNNPVKIPAIKALKEWSFEPFVFILIKSKVKSHLYHSIPQLKKTRRKLIKIYSG